MVKRLARPELLCAGIVFVVSLFLYSWTLAPTVTLVDSGELIVAARFLGVAHPPGFPFYVMLAHLASLVPWGSVALRINLASALFAALASAALTLIVVELMKIRGVKKGLRHAESADDSVTNTIIVFAPALTAGLLLAFSRTLWSYATIAEVYTLNTLLILIVFFLMLRWRRRIIEDERWASVKPTAISDYDGSLYVAAALFGLALGVHHVTVALMLPALGVIVYRTQGWRFFASKRLLLAALFSIACLLAVYSYLPIAASQTSALNWGDPRSFQEIWWHITGKQYQVNLSIAPGMIGEHFVEFGRFALREFGFWWLPLGLLFAIIGLANRFKHDRTIFWFLVLIIVADLAYALSYDIAEDKDAYYLPTFVALAIAAAFGMGWLLQFLLRSPWLTRRLHVLALLPVLLVPAVALAGNWPFNNRRHYFIAHDYIENILGAIKPNGLLLTLDWQVESPMLYAREVEQRRRDVRVVDILLLHHSWYFDYLRRSYPDLIERSRDKVDAFVAELKEWEHHPETYARDAARTQQIAFAFGEMLQSFIAKESEIASVYVTSDIIFADEEQDKELSRWLTKNYRLVPYGLIFGLDAHGTFHDPGELRLQTRGLTDGTLRFEKDDVVNLKVLPVYKTMLVNRARYFALFKKHQRAIDTYTVVLALDPKFEPALRGMMESIKKLEPVQKAQP